MTQARTDAMDTLRVMFPGWEPQALEELLAANQGQLEPTIDMALFVEPPPASASLSSSSLSPSASPLPAPMPSSPMRRASSQSVPRTSPRGHQRQHVKLPDDFLRLPEYALRAAQEQQDAELALLLQNESFRDELMANEEFSAHFGRRSSSISRRASQSSAADVAISTFNTMKQKFSTMSEVMKQKAHEMYVEFQARNNAPAERDPYQQRPLMADDSSDEEDDDDGGRNLHRRNLQDGIDHENASAFEMSPRRRAQRASAKKDD